MTKYDRHPSEELNAIFAIQDLPYQGQDPHKSKIIVIGLDANYSPEICAHAEFFETVLDYHKDGVEFWKERKFHHPFLSAQYPLLKNTGGVPYHRKFTWLGLESDFADKISFIELLPFPTTGRTESFRFWELFDLEHAAKIDQLVTEGDKRMVLLSSSLCKYMAKALKVHRVFEWLPSKFSLGQMAKIGNTSIYGAPHFSSTTYKKTYFENVGRDIRDFCQLAS